MDCLPCYLGFGTWVAWPTRILGSAVQRATDLTFSPPQYEARSRLQQLSGSSAISSSDLFGDVDGAHGAGGPGAE